MWESTGTAIVKTTVLSCVPTVEYMTIRRMDHVGIVDRPGTPVRIYRPLSI